MAKNTAKFDLVLIYSLPMRTVCPKKSTKKQPLSLFTMDGNLSGFNLVKKLDAEQKLSID